MNAVSAAYVAYFPLWLAWRGLGAGEIAFVLALPQIARVFAPAAWGWLADRSGAQRAIVVFSCAVMVACYAAMPYAGGSQQMIDAKLQEMKDLGVRLNNPLINAAFTFIEPFPVGLLLTLISAAILRKKPKLEDRDQKIHGALTSF